MSSYLNTIEDISSVDDVTILGDAAFETELLLLALRDECSSHEEFASLVESCATEMALYDVIDEASVAVEAVQKIVIQDYKNVKLDRVAHRAAIRLAEKENGADYRNYKKYRDLMLEFREKLYKRYLNKGKVEARKSIMNSRNRASNMTSSSGKSIVNKMDKHINAARKTINNKQKP